MQAKDVVAKQNGFHVLFAKKFTTLAGTFDSEIRIIWQARNIISDAKSILGLMALDVTAGTVLKLTAEGPDEQRAIEELGILFELYE